MPNQTNRMAIAAGFIGALAGIAIIVFGFACKAADYSQGQTPTIFLVGGLLFSVGATIYVQKARY